MTHWREQSLSPQQRLLFHQAESGPTMEELHVWLVRQFDQRRVEPNSALGGAISYLLKHWEKLTLFCGRPERRWTITFVNSAEKVDPSSAEFPLLQDVPRGPCGRRVHELDSHLRTLRGQSFRLPHGTRPPCGPGRREPAGLDAVELPAGTGRRQYNRLIPPGSRSRPPATKDFTRPPERHGHSALLVTKAA